VSNHPDCGPLPLPLLKKYPLPNPVFCVCTLECLPPEPDADCCYTSSSFFRSITSQPPLPTYLSHSICSAAFSLPPLRASCFCCCFASDRIGFTLLLVVLVGNRRWKRKRRGGVCAEAERNAFFTHSAEQWHAIHYCCTVKHSPLRLCFKIWQ